MAKFCGLVDRLLSLIITIEVVGRTDIAEDTPAVLAANHRSLADLWVGLAVFHRLGVYPGILFNRKFLPGPLAPLAAGAGVILVSKGGATEAGVAALERGRSLMVMPEGRLYYNPDSPTEIGSVKPGAARMARLSGRPMVPVTVDGTEICWPLGSWPRFRLGRKQRVVVTIGDATLAHSDDDQAETERVMGLVADSLTTTGIS